MCSFGTHGDLRGPQRRARCQQAQALCHPTENTPALTGVSYPFTVRDGNMVGNHDLQPNKKQSRYSMRHGTVSLE